MKSCPYLTRKFDLIKNRLFLFASICGRRPPTRSDLKHRRCLNYVRFASHCFLVFNIFQLTTMFPLYYSASRAVSQAGLMLASYFNKLAEKDAEDKKKIRSMQLLIKEEKRLTKRKLVYTFNLVSHNV